MPRSHHPLRVGSFCLVPMLAASIATAQTHVLQTVNGPQASGGFGLAVAACDDLDGDGVRDFAAGMPGQSGRGQIRLVSGRTGASIGGWRAFATGDGLGLALAAATIAGVPTIAAGAPTYDLLPLPFAGDESGGFDFARVSPPMTMNGSAAGEELGAAVAGLGDVDGDAIADLLVGAPGFQTTFSRGRVRVVSGRTGAVIRTHSGSTLFGNERFGQAVAGLVDVNGDGVEDYAIADPLSDSSGVDAGQVKIFSGALGNLLLTLDGASAGEHFGAAMAGLVRIDANGPGFTPGIAVGAPFANSGGLFHSGRVTVFRANTGAVAHTFGGHSFVGAGGGFGTSVAMLSDQLTPTDLLVGAPGASVGNVGFAGKVFGFSMLNGTLNLTVPNPSPQSGDAFGTTIAARADLDGDGDADDFAVGVPLSGSSAQGRVRLFTGNGSTLPTWTGQSFDQRMGSSLAFLGDLDGDGAVDVAAGGIDGIVEVRSSTTGALLRTLTTPSSPTGASLASAGSFARAHHRRFGVWIGLPGADLGSSSDIGQVSSTVRCEAVRASGTFGLDGHAGSALAFVGDQNADGQPDLAVGAPDVDLPAGSGAGRVELFSGADFSLVRSFAGLAAGDRFGAAVGAAGDLNGDTVADLVVGAPGADQPILLVPDVGRVSVFSGLDGALLLSVGGSAADRSLGASVTSLGDISGDGVPDLAAGAPIASFALGAARVRVISGATGSVLRSHSGATGGDGFGSAVNGGGDYDGDGVRDLAVGIPLTDPFASSLPQSGEVRVFSGATGALLQSITGPAVANAHFGFALEFGGDFNGDCRPDLVVSAPFTSSGQVRLVARFGIPPQSLVFGTGCPGSGGITPVITTFGGTPNAQGAPGFGFGLTCALGGTIALLIGGSSNTTWNGAPLPIALAPIGFPNCQLLVAADVLVPVITTGVGPGAGQALYPAPIPVQPALGGLVYFAQWFVLDPGAANGAAAMSPALELHVLQTP